MEVYEILLPLALVLFLSKTLGLVSKKIGMPAVIGMLCTGIFISLLKYIPGVNAESNGFGGVVYHAFFSEEMLGAYSLLSKIGVVLIMFSAGLGTEIGQIKKNGASAMVITTFGVITPMALGFLVAYLFDYFTAISLIPGVAGAKGEVNLLSDFFYGAILTATSVSITVATLKELGKLNTNEGTSIIAAAVIDDVIGIVILSVLTGLNSSGDDSAAVDFFTNPTAWMVVLKIALFFVFAIGAGILLRKAFKILEARWPHHRRLPIYSLAVCFFYAYIAEKIFGVADITGAYMAGIMLCGLHDTEYEERRADSLGYLIFTPIFFANIGIQYFNFNSFSGLWLAFGLCYVVAALLGKLVGCGAGGLLCHYNLKDSTKIGLGMMVRAEVVLVCAQKGMESGLVSSDISTYVCIIIILSSFVVPLFLKLLYREPKVQSAERL